MGKCKYCKLLTNSFKVKTLKNIVHKVHIILDDANICTNDNFRY